ncbi:hypothetical protein MaudCBS49596_004195 [Microsporum audouinii]
MKLPSLLTLGAALLPLASAVGVPGGAPGGALGAKLCQAATIEVWQLPIPGDCTRFIKCELTNAGVFTGLSEIISCTDGQFFNPIIQTCDDPAASGCIQP